ncbi:hypothetical protein U14_00003 [Candidatus Moduliflexus flocculans]|uniref:DUF2281 domain-containing protein n=1 Tax=Candidatus Moduliflexus flocculans TaxID=1499966 RepID=A0A0S6VTB4_9BACT|nr:hypothetical protein U14_00003 [Candidatus Moduliflexus flocculans]
MITTQQLSKKCELLDPIQRETVAEFIDFLIVRHQKPTSDKKAILLQTSVWDEESLRQVQEAQQAVNTWKPPVF